MAELKESKTVQGAVVHDWTQPPHFLTFDLPAPTKSQVQIKVLAAGLHRLVRARASGQHYSVKTLPHVPGVDGVGIITSTGERVYFLCFYDPTGSFAQYVNVEKGNVFPLPPSADAPLIAAIMNPAMSSWMALMSRAKVPSSFSVFILGCTGVSGLAAVQVAKALKATKIVGAGRKADALAHASELGLDVAITLSDDADFSDAADVDVVLDYLWGDAAKKAMESIVKARRDPTKALKWVEIGSMSGADMTLSASLLRSANIQILGSGPGAFSTDEMDAETPKLIETIVASGMKQSLEVKKLEDIASAWNANPDARVVFEP